MSGFSLDWLLKPANWRKVDEGNYSDDRRRNSAEAPRSRTAELVAVADRLRQQEQHHGG